MDFFNMVCNISGFFFVFNTNFSLLPLNLSENHRKDDKNALEGSFEIKMFATCELYSFCCV